MAHKTVWYPVVSPFLHLVDACGVYHRFGRLTAKSGDFNRGILRLIIDERFYTTGKLCFRHPYISTFLPKGPTCSRASAAGPTKAGDLPASANTFSSRSCPVNPSSAGSGVLSWFLYRTIPTLASKSAARVDDRAGLPVAGRLCSSRHVELRG